MIYDLIPLSNAKVNGFTKSNDITFYSLSCNFCLQIHPSNSLLILQMRPLLICFDLQLPILHFFLIFFHNYNIHQPNSISLVIFESNWNFGCVWLPKKIFFIFHWSNIFDKKISFYKNNFCNKSRKTNQNSDILR